MAATAAKAASSKAKEKPFSFFKGFGIPLIGFGVGWGGYSAMEQFQLVDSSVIQWTHLYNLKLQRMVQQQLPETLAQRMTFTKEQLDAMILHLEAATSGNDTATNAQAERVPFKKILADCRPQEQMEWLTDHVSEDVPYFFIADIFHSWAELHESAFLLDPTTKLAESPSPVYDSKELTQGVWKKMINEVIPFDVGVRVLCVLTRLGPQNASLVNGLHSDVNGNKQSAVDTILRLHQEYRQQLNVSGRDNGNVVPVGTVDAATAVLLTTLNEAAVHGRRFPWIGRSPSGPFPLLNASRREQWCAQLSHIVGDDLVSGLRVDQVNGAHYQCIKK
ncbi:membrane-associated protein, putative [Bodo saltans]|uniref:Membrane-associated protein, putative n=1 Tax=Bodo saltans TaxID=75058 RepID=A0A0S4J6X6_BODSA|nr:membrane-associated protein, putative [Bodo saltans]|eukprot:CUG86106.1 membrane-associated protein, putative [Bodo saltans]